MIRAVPKLAAVLANHKKFVIGKTLQIIKQRGPGGIHWVKHEKCACVIGKIQSDEFTFWQRPELNGYDVEHINVLITALEENPLAAAKNYGLLSGICCSCGRLLTNEGSVEAGIGPICATKFG